MRKPELQLIDEKEYQSTDGVILFEDEHSFSYGKINLEKVTLKFSWNSRVVIPIVKVIDKFPFIFIGVDRYVAGYNFENNTISFYLNLDSNFKWYDDISDGIAIVAETEIYLVDISSLCALRDIFFFGDIIMGTKVENGQLVINFLVDDNEIINI